MMRILFCTLLLLLGNVLIVHAQLAPKEFQPKEGSEAIEAFKKGNKAYNAKMLPEAIEHYTQAIAAFPNYVDAFNNLGQAYRRAGNVDAAVKNFEQSLALYPKGALARTRMAAMYYSLKKYDLALFQYEKLKIEHPENGEGYYGAGRIRMIYGDYFDARIDASKAIELYRKGNQPQVGDATMLLGLIYYYDGQLDNARKYLKEAESLGMSVPAPLRTEIGL